MGHGTHAEHGNAHGAAASAHGPAEIPPVPLERSITPAPEDFVGLPGAGALLWPWVWAGLAVLLVCALLAYGWHATH